MLPPVATSRTARQSWSPSPTRSLRRYAYPAAPSESNEIAYSGSSYCDRTTTPVPGCRLRTSFAASMPSFWKLGGMRMSVTTTCGASSVGAVDQPVEVLGDADDFEIRLRGEQGPHPFADEQRVVREEHGDPRRGHGAIGP